MAPKGKNILHKNRDLQYNLKQIVVRIPRTSPDEYDFLGTKSVSSLHCNAGINSQGLAVAYNFSYDSVVVGGISPTLFVERILKACANIDDENGKQGAYSYILENYWQVNSSGTILLADTKKVSIVQFRPCGYYEYACGMSDPQASLIYSENVAEGATNHFTRLETDYGTDNSIGRKQVIDTFFEGKKSRGVTLVDCFELSRNPTICRYEDEGYVTVSGVTFAIDKEKPGTVSCMWVAFGAPDTSIYTPFHTNLLQRKESGDNGFVLPFDQAVNDKWGVWKEDEETPREDARIFTLAQNIKLKNKEKGLSIPAIKPCEYSQLFLEAKLKSQGVDLFYHMDKTLAGVNYRKMFAMLGRPFVAHELDVDRFPFDGKMKYLNQFLDAESVDYEAITLRDNFRWKTKNPGSYDRSVLWFEWHIEDLPEALSSIRFSFEGSVEEDEEYQSAGIFLLRADRDWEDEDAWVRLGDFHRIYPVSREAGLITEILTEDFSSYIDKDGMLTWAVALSMEGKGLPMYADFIEVNITLK